MSGASCDERQSLLGTQSGKPCFPYRYKLVVLVFFGLFNAMTSRYCFNIALVAMVNYTEPLSTNFSDECVQNHISNSTQTNSDKAGEFDWSPKMQSLLLASFFYGYVFTQLPGGYLAEQIGSKLVFGLAVFVPSVLSLLTPWVARWSPEMLIVLRILMGLTEGPLFPSYNALMGLWSPPMERSQMILWSGIGSPIGTIASQFLTGLLCSVSFLDGWPLPFYLFGICGVVWSLFWMLLAHNSPETCPVLSAAEKIYILSSLSRSGAARASNVRRSRPWRKFLLSRPCLALYLFNLFDGVAYNGFICGIPIYLHQILRFNMYSNGTITAIPYLGQACAALFAGWFADWLRRNYFSTGCVRNMFTIIGEGTAMLCTAGMAFVTCNHNAAIGLYYGATVAMGLAGGGAVANVLDIAPGMAGTLYGIANTAGNAGGFLAPMLIGYITDDSTDSTLWGHVFLGMGGCFLLAMLCFVLLSSGEEQDWARDPDLSPIEYTIQDPPGNEEQEVPGYIVY